MPDYMCRTCKGKSTSPYKCTVPSCKASAGKDPFELWATATKVQTKVVPNKATRKLDDPPTQQVISQKISNHRFVGGRKDQVPMPSGTPNGPMRSGGETTKTTNGTPPNSRTQSPPRTVGENRTPEAPRKEETKETGVPDAKELMAEAKDLLVQLKKLVGVEERDKALELVKKAVEEKNLLGAVEDLRARVPNIREQLIRAATALLNNLKKTLDQKTISAYVQRVKAAQDPKGEAPETLIAIVQELRNLNQEPTPQSEPSPEVLKRQQEEERLRKEEEERKHKEEEERQRQEEERQRKEEEKQKRAELVQQAKQVLSGLIKSNALTSPQVKKYVQDINSAGTASAVEKILRELQETEEQAKRQEERKRKEEEEERLRKEEEERKRKEEEEERQRQEEERKRKEEEEQKRKELFEQAKKLLGGLFQAKVVNREQANTYLSDLKSAKSGPDVDKILQELKGKAGEWKRQEEERKRNEEEERKRREEPKRKQEEPKQQTPRETPVGERIKTLKVAPKEKQVLEQLARGRPEVAKGVVEALEAFDDPASVREARSKLEKSESEFQIAEKALKEKTEKYEEAEKLRVKAETRQAQAKEAYLKNTSDKKLMEVWQEAQREYTQAAQKAFELQVDPKVKEDKRLAEKTWNEAKASLENVQTEAQRQKRQLLNAVRFGALSRPTPDPEKVTGLSEGEKTKRKELARKREEATSAILADLKDHPDLAFEALELLQESEHPEAFAGGVAKLGVLNASNFGGAATTPAEARKMRRNVLKMASLVGGTDYFDRMTAYYQGTDHLKPDPNRVTGKDGTQQTTQKYAGAIGRALIDLDPSAKGVKDLRDGLQFHPDSLKDPLPALAMRVEKFLGDLRDPETLKECKKALGDVKAPSQENTKDLVRKTLGVTGSGPVNGTDAKASVLSVMLTPLTQGQVGSCFATCNCMDFQDKKPVEMMQDLAGMVNTGTLAKGGMDPVPVVLNLPPNENALLRSWEYTVATLGARGKNSDLKSGISNAVDLGLNKFFDEDPQTTLRSMDKGWARAQRIRDEKVERALQQRNAGARQATETANAGLQNGTYKTTEEAQRARDQKVRELDEIYNRAVESANREREEGNRVRNQKLANLSKTIGESFHFSYDPTLERGSVASDGSSSKGGWLMKRRPPPRRGGSTQPVEELVDSEETFKICLKEAMVTAFGDDADPTAIQGVLEDGEFMSQILGAYATKGKPWRQGSGGSEKYSKKVLFGGEPETKPLYTPKEGNSPQIQSTNTKGLLSGLVETLKESPGDTVTLTVPGHAERGLPKHPSLDILKSGGPVSGKVEEVFQKAKKTATTPLEPEQATYLYDKALRSLFEDYEDLTGGLAKTEPPTGGKTPGQLREALLGHAMEKLRPKFVIKTEEDEQILANEVSGKIDGLLTKELYPEFVLADTNWGDSKERYLHVVAPDPKTGEPKLWQKGVFSGSMEPAKESYTTGGWGSTN